VYDYDSLVSITRSGKVTIRSKLCLIGTISQRYVHVGTRRRMAVDQSNKRFWGIGSNLAYGEADLEPIWSN